MYEQDRASGDLKAACMMLYLDADPIQDSSSHRSEVLKHRGMMHMCQCCTRRHDVNTFSNSAT